MTFVNKGKGKSRSLESVRPRPASLSSPSAAGDQPLLLGRRWWQTFNEALRDGLEETIFLL
jgi:hypothetical protein